MVAAKALDFHIEAARERQRVAGAANLQKHHEDTGHKIKTPADTRALVVAILQQLTPEPGTSETEAPKAKETLFDKKALSQAGKLLNVSGRSVAAAAVVLKHGTDDEKKDVETGTVGLAKVEKQVRERVQNAPRPEEKQLEMRICITMLVQ